MSLSSPWLLVLGLLVIAALVTGVVLLGRRRSSALAAAGIAVPGGRRRSIGIACTLAGLVVLALAAAGPTASLPVGREAGTVIVTIDVSTSMTATDVTPSRFAAAQAAAIAFIQAQPDTVDVGVVGFNQGAITTTLPNPDHTAAITSIKALQVAGGTSLGAAIVASLTAITGKTVTLGGSGSGTGSGSGSGAGSGSTGGAGSTARFDGRFDGRPGRRHPGRFAEHRLLALGDHRDVLRRRGPVPGRGDPAGGDAGTERRNPHRHGRGSVPPPVPPSRPATTRCTRR